MRGDERMVQRFKAWKKTVGASRKGGIFVVSIVLLFILIGLLTSVKPAYRISLDILTRWTNEIDRSTFLHVLGMENRMFRQHLEQGEYEMPRTSEMFLQVATSIKIDDPRTFLGGELPGFNTFGNTIIVAGEGTDYTNLSVESSPPLKHVLEERNAIMEEALEEDPVDPPMIESKDVVFLYNSHNRESFLPHLPEVTEPDKAFHNEVNIGKVSEKFAQKIGTFGIGSQVDDTDIMHLLNEKEWTYSQSYQASRPVVEEALATNKDIQYIFDFHRDSLPRDKTTKDIDGVAHGKILFVVGAEFPTYEKNLELATTLHYLIEEKYPGLSRGVLTKEGSGTNGVFNQDVLENALLVEFGGYDNTLEELYRTSDKFAEIFSDYYWEAEKVSGEE